MRQIIKLYLVLPTILLLLDMANAQAPDTMWTRTYGGIRGDESWSVEPVSGIDSGFIIVGFTRSFGEGAPTNPSIYLIRTNYFGDTMWTRIYGGTGGEWGHSVHKTTDGGYIIAGATLSFGINGDFYLIKTDSIGDTLWTRTYGGSDAEWGFSMQQTHDNGFIITGETYSFGAGGSDFYLIKTDSSGDTLWTRTYGGSFNEHSFSVKETYDNGFIIAGVTYSFGAGGSDFYLIKTDSSGDTLWTRTYGGGEDDYGRSVQQTKDGGFIVSGASFSFECPDYQSIYLVRTNSSGDTLWTRSYESYDGMGASVQEIDSNEFIIAGWAYFSGKAHDVYIFRIDSLGDTIWTKTIGGTNTDFAESLQKTSDGGFIIAGVTTSFGIGVPNQNIYLIKLKPEIGIEENKRIKKNYNLSISQNPFVKLTTFKYELPVETSVSLNIYNASGKLIKTLVNEQKQPGTYSVDFNAEGLPTGIYFAKIKAESYKDTQKLILMR